MVGQSVYAVMLMLMLVCAGEARAQQPPRVEVGPLVRVDHVRVEGDLAGPMTTAGVGMSVRVTKSVSLETEVTRASGPLERSDTGTFVGFDGVFPTARRDLRYEPGWGAGGAVAWRGALSPRVHLGVKLGLAGRRFVEASTYTILTMPPGLDPDRVRAAFIDEQNSTSRGGIWLGVDAPVRITPRLRLIPEARYVHGPRQVGNAHHEWSLGVRGVWGL